MDNEMLELLDSLLAWLCEYSEDMTIGKVIDWLDLLADEVNRNKWVETLARVKEAFK